MYTEDELLPLSGLQHLAFCERRWALVHLERLWAENVFTAEGLALHERAHSAELESRPRVLVRRTLAVHSLELGLSGQCDVVEFERVEDGASGVVLTGRRGRWRPYPIEYKRSSRRGTEVSYALQLCAQALCLEEMLGTEVPVGAIYDGKARKRHEVVFDEGFRAEVRQGAARMHELFEARKTPGPVAGKKCHSCSLNELCLPEAVSGRSASAYVRRALAAELRDAGGQEVPEG